MVTEDNQYQAGQNTFMNTVVNLGTYASATLTFWLYANTQAGDNLIVKANNTALNSFGTTAGWTQETVDLSGFAGNAAVTVEFDFLSQPGGTIPAAPSGCWIDDVLIQGNVAATAGPLPFLQPIKKVTAPNQAVNAQVWFYDNNSPVAEASIAGNNNVIEVTGPNGYNQFADNTGTLVNAAANGAVLATYAILPPNGVAWRSIDNGVYTVSIIGATVLDGAGNAAGSGPLGSFTVAINNAPVAVVTTPVGPKAGNIPISYTLSDTESNPTNITVQYSADAGVTWHTATQGFGGNGLYGLTTSPAGVAHTFVWNSTYNLGPVVDTTVEIRITPKDAFGTGAPVTTANFTVDDFHTDHGPTVAVAAAAGANPVLGTTVALSALGAENWNSWGANILTYTWVTTGVVPAAVVFSANGTNAAKNTMATFTEVGTYHFSVTIADTLGKTVTSSVAVVVSPVFTSITLNPGAVTVQESTTQKFTAYGLDQFGHLMASQPTFTYSVVGGGVGGSINSSTGLYTAPAAVGTDTVKATSGLISKTALATVQAAPVALNEAFVTIAGAGSYVLYVNGVQVATGSGYTVSQMISDIALNPGQNVIAIKDTNPWGNGGVMADVIINGVRMGQTSSAWTVNTSGPTGWNNIGFDDSLWAPATQYGGLGVTPLNRTPKRHADQHNRPVDLDVQTHDGPHGLHAVHLHGVGRALFWD